MKTLFRFPPLLIVFILSACSDDQEAKLPAEKLLTKYDWEYVSTSGRVVGTVGQPYPVLSIQYDLVRFSENKTLSTVLPPFSSQVVQVIGEWSLTGNTLVLNGNPVTIEKLTHQELIFVTANGSTVKRKAIAK